MVGPLPDWPVDTEACRGTLGMNECIEQRAGTIGYNEAGIGVFAELQEISIQNKYGRLLNSQIAAANGGIGAKESDILPKDATGDFSSVSLLDQDGEYTWPITLLTYIYVRNDLSFKTDPVERALLVAFLKALFDPSFVSRCETEYGFALPAGASLDLSTRPFSFWTRVLAKMVRVGRLKTRPSPLSVLGITSFLRTAITFRAWNATPTCSMSKS